MALKRKIISVAMRSTYNLVITMWFLSHFDFNLFAVMLPQVPFFLKKLFLYDFWTLTETPSMTFITYFCEKLLQ